MTQFTLLYFVCHPTVYFVSLWKGISQQMAVWFIETDKELTAMGSFWAISISKEYKIHSISFLFTPTIWNSQTITSRTQTFSLFCFLLLFVQFYYQTNQQKGKIRIDWGTKPSFCSLLVRKACKKKETVLARFHDIITHSNFLLIAIVFTC